MTMNERFLIWTVVKLTAFAGRVMKFTSWMCDYVGRYRPTLGFKMFEAAEKEIERQEKSLDEKV